MDNRSFLAIFLAAALAGCASPLSKRDIVTIEAGGQEHRALSRSCQPLGNVRGYTMTGSPRGDNSLGHHNAKQAMLRSAPEDATHIAYGSAFGFGTLAQGEAFRCREGFNL